MHYRLLGRTGLQAGAVSMGAGKLFEVHGRQALEHGSALVTEALRGGVNLFDTASMSCMEKRKR